MNEKSELFNSISLEISLVPFTKEQRCVKNKRCLEGGYKKIFKVKKPKLSVSFIGTTKQKLIPHSLYLGTGGCVFYAISENELVNIELIAEKFTLPNEIVEISKHYKTITPNVIIPPPPLLYSKIIYSILCMCNSQKIVWREEVI
jgi:hypothetical protein